MPHITSLSYISYLCDSFMDLSITTGVSLKILRENVLRDSVRMQLNALSTMEFSVECHK